MALWNQTAAWNENRHYGLFKERIFDDFAKPIRPLRFEGANVIIALSPRPEDVLLVHSAMLEHSPFFKTGLSNRWSTSGKQISTDTQLPANTTVYKYGMVLDADREGYTIIRNSPPDEEPFCDTHTNGQKDIRQSWLGYDIIEHECEMRTAHKTVDFHRSTYCQSMPSDLVLPSPSPLCISTAHRHAVRDHKILFAMLYQIEVNFDGFFGDELIACIANVAAYAEYYGLLPFVAKSLEGGLDPCQTAMHCKLLNRPILWLALGYMLRSETIFAEALRHFVGGDWVGSFAASNPDWQDVILLAYKKQLELARRLSRTDRELYRLTLVPQYHPNLAYFPRYTYLSEEKNAKKIKSEEAKARYLARNALGGFLATSFKNPAFLPRGGSNEAFYPWLLQRASRGDISIFGIEAPSRLSGIFKLKVGQSKRPPQEVIEKEMRRALKEVKIVLECHLFPEHCLPAQKKPENDNKHAETKYYFTHMSIDSDEMPWAKEDAWKPITPDFEVNAASQAWLDQVGLGHVECDMECVEAGGLALFHQPSTFDPRESEWYMWQEKSNNGPTS